MVTLFPELEEVLPCDAEVFLRVERGPFPESRATPPFCSEPPFPVSSTSSSDFHSVKILDAPLSILAASKPTLSSSPR
jgi:hypothetical protein